VIQGNRPGFDARYSVPRENRTRLEVPSAGELPELLRQNRVALDADVPCLDGSSLRSLREECRREVLQQAQSYTRQLTGADGPAAGVGPLVVTGHQPELFHAGVWAKNFAVARVARRSGGVALNLMIDSDTADRREILIPTGSRTHPRMTFAAFDAFSPQQPWEDARIEDRSCFRSFGERVARSLRDDWGFVPLAASVWETALTTATSSGSLVDGLAAARRQAELQCGINNLELPWSRVCQTRVFCQFAAFLMSDLPRFHAEYNSAVRDYRFVHRIRSSTHPVPDLGVEGDWYEAPFWIWRGGTHRRERPFVRAVTGEWELRSRDEIVARLPRHGDGATSGLQELSKGPWRLRTRALTTTLFARVFLADLFVHGIGGAKYDAMTDRLCERVLGLTPPPFATVSAALHLPLGEPFGVTRQSLRQVDRAIRDFQFNPERSGAVVPDSARERIAQKERVLAGLSGRRPTPAEHRHLETLRTELARQFETRHRELRALRARLQEEWAANQILKSREFAWCLHPQESIVSFLGDPSPR